MEGVLAGDPNYGVWIVNGVGVDTPVGTLNVLRSAGLVKPGPLGPREPPNRG